MGEASKKTAIDFKDVPKDVRLAMIVSRFNEDITQGLVQGAERALSEFNLSSQVTQVFVPGALEIPYMVKKLASTYDGFICLGAVVRGETAHFDYVCLGVTQGLMQVQLSEGVPLSNGILTTENKAQAIARSSNDEHNKGYEAVKVVIEMVLLDRKC